MALSWTRHKDGEHNGRPVYEYEARSHGIKYHIYNASDAGFGVSISFEGGGYPEGAAHRIIWCRALYRCKAYAEAFESKRGLACTSSYANGAPMFTADGMMLDDQGNRSIFDDVDD